MEARKEQAEADPYASEDYYISYRQFGLFTPTVLKI